MEGARVGYSGANAVCERFLGSVRRECLDHGLIMSERPLDQVLKEDVTFLNAAQPHQGIQQKIPAQIAASAEDRPAGKIIAFPILNGLHIDFRKAA